MVKPKAITDDELAQSFIDSITAVTRKMRSMKLPGGLTRERLAILALIAEKGPISVGDLANMAKVKGPTMSRMTSSLIDEELARRQVHKEDGRGVLITLTAKGQRVLASANQKSLQHVKSALRALSTEQVSALSALVGALRDSKDDATP